MFKILPAGVLSIFAGSCSGYHGYMGQGHMNNFGGGGMFIFWIILIAAILFGAYFFYNKNVKGNESSLEILKRRLASGEISQEEYEKLKEQIK